MDQLQLVTEGRLFLRQVTGATYHGPCAPVLSENGPFIAVGVVALPRRADLERLHAARLNSALYLDVDKAGLPSGRMGALTAGDLAERPIGDILTTLDHASYPVRDMANLFVRATAIVHANPDMRWAYVCGGFAHPPFAGAKDGLYEIGAGGAIALIDGSPFTGEAINSVLREPLWGPAGAYGLETSMEPGRYPAWLAQERARQLASPSVDPMYLRYLAAIARDYPQERPLAYTRAERDTWSKISRDVVKRLLEESSQDSAETSSAKPARRRP